MICVLKSQRFSMMNMLLSISETREVQWFYRFCSKWTFNRDTILSSCSRADRAYQWFVFWNVNIWVWKTCFWACVQHDNLNGRLVFLKVNFESGSNLEVTFVCRSGLAMVSSLTSQSFSMFMMLLTNSETRELEWCGWFYLTWTVCSRSHFEFAFVCGWDLAIVCALKYCRFSMINMLLTISEAEQDLSCNECYLKWTLIEV